MKVFIIFGPEPTDHNEKIIYRVVDSPEKVKEYLEEVEEFSKNHKNWDLDMFEVREMEVL